MSDKEIVANKVERYLKEIFPAAQKKAEGQFSVAFESTRIWIYVEDGQVPKLEKTKAWHLKHACKSLGNNFGWGAKVAWPF